LEQVCASTSVDESIVTDIGLVKVLLLAVVLWMPFSEIVVVVALYLCCELDCDRIAMYR
jgi:hypothetical protein